MIGTYDLNDPAQNMFASPTAQSGTYDINDPTQNIFAGANPTAPAGTPKVAARATTTTAPTMLHVLLYIALAVIAFAAASVFLRSNSPGGKRLAVAR